MNPEGTPFHLIFKILIPHDGSKPADKTLNQAVMLVKMIRNNSEIILLNVVEEIPLPPRIHEVRIHSKKTDEELPISAAWKELHQEIKSEALKMLEKKQNEIPAGVTIKIKVLFGYPSEKIIECSDDENVDLIVIGNVGLGGISRLKALGSVSRTVAEKAKRPVMIVH